MQQPASFDPAQRRAAVRRTVGFLVAAIVVILGLFLLQFVV
ncbi:hypothetical protein [Oleiagrimonas soli]|uniref:Uncharacterized protein n=1 Tax=Oleiagrimonas soli TaxID=1543381 RepID=A0A841KIT2_9GAMM|nr:hypothetical protein [Oleiagrimonas soli]MBB6185096.1 hypothetical protein [Oleiagrimonas soli]